MNGVTVIAHPLVQHNLARLRDRGTRSQEFRRLLGEIAALMIYEATRSFGVKPLKVRTPLESARGFRLEREVVLVPVLRAGLGMLDSILQLIPHARVGFIGLKREETTLRAVFYHKSFPKNLGRFEVVLIDPMLATGGRAGFAGRTGRQTHPPGESGRRAGRHPPRAAELSARADFHRRGGPAIERKRLHPPRPG